MSVLSRTAITAGVAAVVAVASMPPASAVTFSPVLSGRQITADWLGVNSQGTTGDWGGLVGTFDGKPLPTNAFGSVRFWDDTTELSTKWCDIAPTADADLEANLTAKLDPKLDAAAAAGIKRVVMVVGHAAPWTMDAESDTSPLGTFGTAWFCAGERSAVSIPSLAWMGTASEPGPGWTRFEAYSTALLDHIAAWSTQREGGMPFELALQTMNEPSAMLFTTTGVANSATSIADAARSLRMHEQILRSAMSSTTGLDYSRVTLLTSPVTNLGTFTKAYWGQANTYQETSYANFSGLYDGVSFQTYSKQDSTAPLTSDQLVAGYDRDRIAVLTTALDGGTYPALKPLPRLQTETNHGFSASRSTYNQTGYSAADRVKLMSRLVMSGLRWNLDAHLLYTFGGVAGQYPMMMEPQSPGLANDESTNALLSVRRWIIGHVFTGCSVASNVVRCTLVDPHDTSLVRTVAYLDDASAGAGSITLTSKSKAWRPNGTVAGTYSAGATVPLTTTPLFFDPVADPHGAVESVKCNLAPGSTTSCASVTVSGWAVIANGPAAARIDVYRGGARSKETLVGTTTADLASPELMVSAPEYYNPVGATTSRHRFTATLPVTSVTKSTPFYVYAVDTTANRKRVLNSSGTLPS